VNKEWKSMLIFLGILLFLAVGIINFNQNDESTYYPSEEKETLKDSEEIKEVNPPYYFNYYFVNTDVPFPEFERKRVELALNNIRIDTKNNFIFNETNKIQYADLIFNFSYSRLIGEAVEMENEISISSVTGGTSYVLGKSYYPYVENFQDEIIIYPTPTNEQMCKDGYPSLEIHEILHGLGLEHANTDRSIMFSFENRCNYLWEDNDSLSKLYEEWNIK